MNRIPILDGWRGLAILSVIASHLIITHDPPGWLLRWTGLGQHGVATFFVLSGFLITRQLLLEQKPDLMKFYIRRAYRLLPCAWSFLVVVLILWALGKLPGMSASEIISPLLFVRNFYFRDGGAITGHFWSLSIEEQFYLVWPWFLVYLRPRSAGVVAAAGALAVVFVRWQAHAFLYSGIVATTYRTQYRADALLLGCLAAIVFCEYGHLFKRWLTLPLVVLLAFCFSQSPPVTPFYESVCLALLIGVTARHGDGWLSSLLNARLLRIAGKYSYSLYLWQQIFLFERHSFGSTVLNVLILLPIVTWASYTYIEEPWRNYGRQLVNRLNPDRGELVAVQ